MNRRRNKGAHESFLPRTLASWSPLARVGVGHRVVLHVDLEVCAVVDHLNRRPQAWSFRKVSSRHKSTTEKQRTQIGFHRGECGPVRLQEALEQESVPLQVVLQAVVDFVSALFQVLSRKPQRLFSHENTEIRLKRTRSIRGSWKLKYS